MEQKLHHLRGRLEVDTEFGAFLGDTRIRLLEAIDQYGSISRAAKAVPLSYKAAWDAMDAMNNLAEQPLVSRLTGGRHGGGSTLTDYGKQLVALYRAIERDYQATLNRLVDSLHDGSSQNVQQFGQLLRRMSMVSSARNQFGGQVIALHKAQVDVEVRIRLDDVNELVAIITEESAETLGLAVGMEVSALVKSSSVLLLTDRQVRLTARNQLWGTVTRIHDGPVNAEISLCMSSGKTICAVVTHESVKHLGLQLGDEACAVFKASAVILCR